MDESEKLKFKQRYADLPDGTLLELLKDGEAGLVEGAYELAKDEAIKRKLVVPEKVVNVTLKQEKDKNTKISNRTSNWSFLFWWKTNPEELKLEVDKYETLKIMASSRGLSFLCCIFLGVVSFIFNYFAKVDFIFWADGLIFILLGCFILRGHRWAMILAMLLWTYEKGNMLYGGIMGKSYGQFNFPTANVFIQIFWWALFMQIFYKAFRVECLRRKRA